jgi:hypothetical protein
MFKVNRVTSEYYLLTIKEGYNRFQKLLTKGEVLELLKCFKEVGF